jgi:hypothetical protein
MRQLKIMSIDPGGTTGWATFVIPLSPTGNLIWNGPLRRMLSDAGQLSKTDHHDNLREVLSRQRPDLIILERFEKRNNDFSLLISCEYIGVVKLYGQQYRCPVVMQGASQALVWCDDVKMKVLEALVLPYTPNKDANAARKHLVYFLVFNSDPRLAEVRLRILEQLKVIV